MVKTMGLALGLFAVTTLVLSGCGPQDDNIGSKHQAASVTWGTPVNVTVNGSNLTKTGTNGWNGGAVSNETFTGDGYVQFTTAENTTWKMAGLSAGDSDQSFTDIDFAFYLAGDGNVRIYEGGNYRAFIGPYAANDTFRVNNASGTVTYWQNGTKVYTSMGTASGTLGLDTSIFSVGGTINSGDVTTQTFFSNEVGVSSSTNNLTKNVANGWGNSGASSTSTFTGDGYVQFTTAENTTWKMAGLSSGDSNQGFGEIQFAFYLAGNGTAYIVESGTQVATVGAYAASDTFRVTNTGGTVTYTQNGTLVYTSTGSASGTLNFDSSLYSNGGTVNSVVVSQAAGFWQNELGVSTSTNSLTKTGTNGWNSGASTTSSLAANGYVEFTTAENTTWKMAGLSSGDSDQGFADIDFAFYLAGNGQAYIYEAGTYVTSAGAYAASDTFRINNTGGTITYLINGTLVHTSTGTATGAQLLDTSLWSNGATINSVVFTDVP